MLQKDEISFQVQNTEFENLKLKSLFELNKS